MLGTCETWDRSRDAVDGERRQKVMCAGSGVTNHESPKRGVRVRSDGVTGGAWYPIPDKQTPCLPPLPLTYHYPMMVR
ncbi:hypothetical protein Pcinc_035742 [Petrolisthes cinctipes]|uniref:Uncharacterized protein n=1 Tax=Petrolisthes cinctipes TaxID=88211 RepID=A0AAE1BX22_PETCI|nr:hypothetical protein Pcinc_035742 [Petrolisthes cinctipes]